LAKENKYIRSLIQSAQYGNNAALEQLFEMNMGRIYALSLRLMGNKPEAEKLTAAVFVSAWKNIKAIRVDTFFANWLMSLAVYNALEELRKKHADKKNKITGKANKNTETEIPVKDPLEREILMLPETERLILVLNKIENYTVEEVSDLLRITNKETLTKTEEAVGKILKILPDIQSADQLFNKLLTITKVHAPDKSVVDNIYNVVHHHRFEEAVKKKAAEKPEEEVIDEEELKKEREEKKKSAELKKKEREEKDKEKKDKPENKKELKLNASFDFSILKAFIIPAVVVIGVAALIFILFSGDGGWEVRIKNGSVIRESEEISENTTLPEGKTVSTTANSYASVSVPGFGDINLDPQTSLQRLKEKNSIRLSTGTIKTVFSNERESFQIAVPSAVISDYYHGYSYNLSLDDLGNSLLSVDKGWLRVAGLNKEIIIGLEYMLEIRKDHGCSLPYHFSASPEVIDLINNISFKAMESSILPLLEISGPNDALTLWNLFRTSGRGVREIIYNKLNSIIPHPDNISKNELLSLDAGKLIVWLKEIQSKMNK